jgi:hypothetical protein
MPTEPKLIGILGTGVYEARRACRGKGDQAARRAVPRPGDGRIASPDAAIVGLGRPRNRVAAAEPGGLRALQSSRFRLRRRRT